MANAFRAVLASSGGGGDFKLRVTCDSDFAGLSVSCTQGVVSLTETCPSTSPYLVEFAIPYGGVWVISSTIDEKTFTNSITVNDETVIHAIPDGSTVVPTDSVQIWLACARINDKSYVSIEQVLNDTTTLATLIDDENACDYLVRCTTWVNTICADETAMADIGANDYCSNLLLSSNDWSDAICNSSYFESILDVKVPNMTSLNTPSGNVFYTSIDARGGQAWWVFDSTDSGQSYTQSWMSTSYSNEGIGYEFTSPVKIYAYRFKHSLITPGYADTSGIKKFKIQKYINNQWIDVTSENNARLTVDYQFWSDIADGEASTKWRIYITESTQSSYAAVNKLQFYGRASS